MQGNLISTVLALIFYFTSSFFGAGSDQSKPIVSPGPSNINQQYLFPRPGQINGKQANIRASATNNAVVVATVTQGSRLTLLDEKSNWYQIQTESGRTGWIAKWLVSTRSTTPVITSSRKTIAAYYVENNANDTLGYQALSRNLGTINTIIPFSFNVDQSGNVRSTHNPKPLALAHSSGAKGLALVNNIKGSNFNSNSIHRLLTSSAARSRAINGINRLIIENGYQGVNIDFENVPSRDRIYVTAFFRELAASLHAQGLMVTASLPAKTYDDRTSSHSGAFDYKALAPYLDQAMIMTYDEHYSGGPAGPVASYPWVEKVIKYALQAFPANRVVVGIAAYGYDWSWGNGKALTYQAIKKIISSHKIYPKWNSVYKVPYFSYKSWGKSHQVWYENAQSTAAKVQLVRNYGLKGVAVWRLGYEDPAIWNTIRMGLQ